MKTVKKIAAICSAAAMTFCMFTLSACSDNAEYDIGVVKGNYGAVATSEQVDTAMKTISESAPFGDTEAADWSYGLNFKANLGITTNFPEISSPNTIYSMIGNVAMNTDYSLSLTKSAEAGDFGLDVKGKGSLAVNAEAGGEKLSMNANVYNDSAYAYLDVAANGEMPASKIKLSLNDLMGEIGGILPGETPDSGDLPSDGNDTEEGGETGSEIGTENIFNNLTELGFNVYIDESDGLKLKMSATRETFDMILQQAGLADGGVSFNQSVFDVYFSLDADGNFEKFGMKLGLNLAVPLMEATAASAAQVATIGISCGISVTAFNGTVTLPSNLDEYVAMS